MNKFYTISKRFMNMLKGLVNSGIKYSNNLLIGKKALDDNYTTINQIKVKEIKDLETRLKDIQHVNYQLEKEISSMKNSIAEKTNFIKVLQNLITKRFN